MAAGRGTLRRVSLSDFYSPQQLADLFLKICRDVKPNGRALYINEVRELFAPVERGEKYERSRDRDHPRPLGSPATLTHLNIGPNVLRLEPHRASSW